MINHTPRQSAEKLFRVPLTEAGSNAEKLLNLRKGMQLRKRELRGTERKIRNAARAEGQPTYRTRRTTR